MSTSEESPQRIAFVLNSLTGEELKSGNRDVSKVYSLLTDQELGMCRVDALKPIHECKNIGSFLGFLSSILNNWRLKDQLIFYFSGHGDIRANQYCLKLGIEDSDWFPFANLMNYLEIFKVRRAILILDACHSGAALEKKGYKESNNTDKISLPIEKNSIPKGIAILASSQKTQTSYDGIFTEIFCKGIESHLDQKGTNDGYIYVEDIVDYINGKIESDEKYAIFPQRSVFSINNADKGIWIAKSKIFTKDIYQQEKKNNTVKSYEELRILYEKTHPNRHPSLEAAIGDLDLQLLKEYANRIEPGLYDRNSIETVLSNLKFYSPITNGGEYVLHKSAVLCFHKRPELIYNQARSVFLVGNPRDKNFVREDIEGSLSYQVKTLVEKVKKYSETISSISENGLRSEVDDIDLDVVRELISNAITHRDYQSPEIIQVKITPKLFEIYSPGTFPKGLSWEKLINDSIVRSSPVDAAISYYLSKLLVFEGIGRGFDIFKQYIKENGSDSITCKELSGSTTLIRLLRRREHIKTNLQLENKSFTFIEQNPLNKLPIVGIQRDNLTQKSIDNLPQRDYSEFIGRKAELKQLLKSISADDSLHITVVEGIGGVGKTSLVLKAAYLCRKIERKQSEADGFPNVPIFDAIIYTSAKKTYLTSRGIFAKPIFDQTLQEIFRTIANVLEQPNIIRAENTEEQFRCVYECLNNQRTILIVDNIETVPDQEQEKILSFLSDLPQSTKAIITTRTRFGIYKSIPLLGLSKKDSIKLIKQEANNKAINITSYKAEQLYSAFGGIPIALIYAVGQLAMGYSLKRILGDKTKLPQDIAQFLFQHSIEPLKGKPAHILLISIAFFQTSPCLDALITVAGLLKKPIDVEEGLAKLEQLSLIVNENERYFILPITRRYILYELTTTKHSEFLREARIRWVEWYIKFSEKYGGEDWQDWRIKYDYLNQEWKNIESVLYWCADEDQYEYIKALWLNIDAYIDFKCYWRTRIHWWEWLMEKSRQRSDLSTYVQAISEKAWTLTQMNNYQSDAASQLAEAWKIRKALSYELQANLANHIAVHRITKNKYRQALNWLNRQNDLINLAHLETKKLIRYQIHIAYYRAEINYWQKNYDKAKELFQFVIEQGNIIGWQRITNYAQNWLADILIREGNLPEAEKILKVGLFIAETNRERRRIAHYQASYARLEKERDNYEKARKYAKKALNIFEKEAIIEDTKEIHALLEVEQTKILLDDLEN